MLAANDGEAEIVRSLLAGGADVDAQDYLGRTPLHAAITGDSLPCVELLLAALPDVSRTTYDEGQSVLHTAIRIGNVSVITALVGALPDLLSTTNMHGDTPIDEAQGLLDHYGQYCAMMARQSGRSPASRAVVTEVIALLNQRTQER
jgi:ankyrin repeat protein